MNNVSEVKLFATTETRNFGQKVENELQVRLPEPMQPEGGNILADHKIEWFPNENPEVKIPNVRGRFVVIIHTQAPPVSDGVIELFALIHAVNNANPDDILLVFPYMPYSRSDRKDKPRISVMGQLFPEILCGPLGMKKVILLDPHAQAIKQYFKPTADFISAQYLMLDYLQQKYFDEGDWEKDECVIVFADAGATSRYEEIPNMIGIGNTAYIHKSRDDNGESQINKVVGEVEGRKCIILDDEIMSGGTMVRVSKALRESGAEYVMAIAPHAILRSSGMTDEEVVSQLENSPIDRFLVTDSVPVRKKLAKVGSEKFTVLPLASFVAEATKRTILNESVSTLHSLDTVRYYA